MKLTVKKVAKILRRGEPGRYFDGQGLYLVVESKHNARWSRRYELHHKAHQIGLGCAFRFTLHEARERNLEIGKQLVRWHRSAGGEASKALRPGGCGRHDQDISRVRRSVHHRPSRRVEEWLLMVRSGTLRWRGLSIRKSALSMFATSPGRMSLQCWNSVSV